MATEDLVTEQFQFLGVDLPSEVLKKCGSLCEEYNVEPEDFVEQWMAFSLSNLDGASPSIEDLKVFERREFSKRAAELNVPVKVTSAATLTVYGAPEQTRSAEDVLSNYLNTSPKRIKTETDGTQHELRPATYSPSVNNSGKYGSRTNGGCVVHSYGEDSLLSQLSSDNSVNIVDLNIAQVPNEDGEIYTKAMFGFELLHEKAAKYDSHISYLSQCIMKKANITEISSVRHKSQNEIYVCGRVECDADARLNPKSVVLQGTWEHSLSLVVPVDLDQVNQYSLFPGQVVVMRGVNPRGDRFIAQQVYCDASRTLPKPDLINILKGTISVIISSGPYTTSDTLAYEPLKDLVQYIGTHKPNLAILMGPFIDSEHARIKDNSMAETYKSLFDKLLDNIAEITSASPHTKIYIVSSMKDAFHMCIFPTPPYTSRRKHPNIHFVPDPCVLDVNGIYIALTSTDVLMHLSREEISHGMGGEKLSRLAGHILQQRCLYPVYPSSLPLDSGLWSAHAQLPHSPHILVLPSSLRHLVKEVNGCVVVNPEHLTKGAGGGTFARLLISNNSKTTKIAAQIVRI